MKFFHFKISRILAERIAENPGDAGFLALGLGIGHLMWSVLFLSYNPNPVTAQIRLAWNSISEIRVPE